MEEEKAKFAEFNTEIKEIETRHKSVSTEYEVGASIPTELRAIYSNILYPLLGLGQNDERYRKRI